MTTQHSFNGKAFEFLKKNQRDTKTRERGITELRGPYYHPAGRRYLEDVFELMGEYVDVLKLGGGVMPLIPEKSLKELINLCHAHDVMVSSGGLLEYALMQGPESVNAFIEESRRLGLDIIEVSTGMITAPPEDIARIVTRVRDMGMKPKPEVGIQFGAGGSSSEHALENSGTADVTWAVSCAKMYLEAGADLIMVESEGITEGVKNWREDVPSRFVNELGLKNVMFEAADFDVFSWYVKNYGPEVNLFVDHSQIIALECVRSGIWANSSLWGRVVTYKG